MEGITPASSANGSRNKYKFSDKELQFSLGMNQYDFEARYYDPAIGRFHVVDPLADLAPDYSSYRYAFDNPVSNSDHTGLFEEYEEEGGDNMGGFNVQNDRIKSPTLNPDDTKSKDHEEKTVSHLEHIMVSGFQNQSF